jgi:hypothetical protein
MTSFSLRQVKLRPGEQYRDELEVELSPLNYGGQRYLPVPDKVPAAFEITRANTGTVFTLLGGIALIAALFVQRRQVLLVVAGTLPLVGWFVATPYNSGPPFLVASLIAPVIATLAGAIELRSAAA